MKKNRTLFLAIAVTLAAALSGCGSKEKVSSSTLEDARSASLTNSVTVAKAYIRENPRLAGMDIVGHSDEHQTATCPQGSGWAYPSAMRQVLDENGKFLKMEKVKLVCSTVSASVGCYREEDFKLTKFAEQAGKCDPELSFPLPKVVGK